MPSKFKAKLSSTHGFRIRSETDIIAGILDEAIEGAKKTHIMYRCNLSYRQLQAYLKLLLSMKLLALHSDLYKTTMKGLEFLKAYRKLKALMA